MFFRLIKITWICLRCGLPEILAHYGIKKLGWLKIFSRRSDAPAGEKLAILLQKLGPAFIKLGQALSSRYDLLGEKFATDLSVLQDRLPAFSYNKAVATIESEFGGKLEDFFSEFAETPAGSASIAQVHKATTTDGRIVAVKILRPDIENTMQSELEFMRWLAGLAEALMPSIRRLRPVEVIKTLAETTELEMDLRLEAAAASELAENITRDIKIPAIDWQRTSRRVMTMEWIEAHPLSEFTGHPEGEKLARLLLHSFFTQVFRFGFFHADLHPGNVFITSEGKIALVDFGIMGRLDYNTRIYLAEMISAFIKRDYHRMAEYHFIAGYVPGNQNMEAFAQACRSIGEPVLGQELSKISIGRLLAQLFKITETFQMHTQPQLILFQKSLVLIEAICRRLEPKTDMWGWSEPPIREWMEAELGIKGKVRHHMEEGFRLLRTLPSLVERADNWLQKLEQTNTDKSINNNLSAFLAAIALGLAIGLLL